MHCLVSVRRTVCGKCGAKAWQAALVSAEDEAVERLRSKLDAERLADLIRLKQDLG